ncbi:MAG: hypothetical protein IAG10_00380, partial [Planctomycetaceae bacterium]|nr:hypothetical protein [Planctomycetaceae bacterium]
VTATTGTGDGTLGIQLLDNNSIVDLSLKPLAGSGTEDGSVTSSNYVLDRTAPALVSFTRSNSANRETNADQLFFRVTFREAVAIDPSDFVVDGLTTAKVTEISEVEDSDGKEFELEIAGGDLSVYNGPVGLNLSASQRITDFAGNPLPTAEPTIDETYLLNDTLSEHFVRLVKDINTDDGSEASQFTVVGDTLFFTANDGIHGRELWKSDGTVKGTVLVKDFSVGEESSQPLGLSSVNGALLFFVGAATGTTELWKSDGTESGTVLVMTLSSEDFNDFLAFPECIAVSNGTLFFSGRDEEHGQELWKSDGTADGTKLVRDINLGEDWSAPFNLIDVNGTLFFVADDGEHGYELWKSDGSEAGTELVAELTVGPDSSDFGSLEEFGLAAVNNTLFFVANLDETGSELWKSDGTAEGTELVKDIRSGSSSSEPGNLTNVDGTLFFSAETSLHGRELWKSDGTAAGTVRLTDVTDGSESLSPTQLTNLNGTLFFLGDSGKDDSRLWKSDGTTAGTVQVFSELPEGRYFFEGLLSFEDRLVFTVRDIGLFVSDGTESGTFGSEVFDELGSRDSTAVLNGSLLFAADDGNGYELFQITTIPPLPTEPHLFDLNPGLADSQIHGFADINGAVVFAAGDFGPNGSVYRTDGTAYVEIQRFEVELNLQGDFEFVTSNGAAFFAADDGVHGLELWKTGGTADTTVLVKDIASDSGADPSRSSFPRLLTSVKDTLFFVARDGLHGDELWKSDGTESGTVLVADLFAGAESSGPENLMSIGDRLFFTADDGVQLRGLWVSDGTAAGTQLVEELDGSEKHFTNVGGTLFFTRGGEYQLWKSDGTNSGTTLVMEFGEPGLGELAELTAFDQQLLFVVHGSLWSSDGTAEGTSLIATIAPEAGHQVIHNLANVGGLVYFSAETEELGNELWKSDGTTAGTVFVKDIAVGDDGSFSNGFVNLGGTIYFTANDPHGTELWKTDGTAEGTVLAGDIRSGGRNNAGSEPNGLTVIGDTLYFTADDGLHGREVWVVKAPDSTTPIVSSIQRDINGEMEPGSVQWKVVFTEPVRGVHLDDFQLVGTGFPEAAITSFVGSGTTYFVTATTGAGTGTLGLELVDDDSIHDSSQNPLGGEDTTGLGDASFLGEAFVLDVAPPTVTSITRTAANRTNASSIGWTVVFSESVTEVNAGDFSLLATGVTGASITRVTGSDNTWVVTVATGSGDGTLGIKLVDDDSISDAVGNPLVGNFTGQVYTLDRTVPSAVSFLRQAPTNSLTNADTLVFRATFSEAVLNVDGGDFVVSGSTATVTNVAAVNGSNGKLFDVTVSGGDLANLEGVVGLDLHATHNITDSVGNALPITEPLAEQTYTLENTAPTVTSFARQTPNTSPTNADTLVFRATFSEQVVNVDAADFAAAGSTTATVVGVALVIGSRGTQYDVTVSGGDLANFNGLVGLNLHLSPTIDDLAGNILAVAEPLIDLTYLLDNVVPSTTSMMRQSDVANPENPSSLLFRVTFSEAVTDIDATDFAVNGATTATVTGISGVSGSGGKSFDVTVAGGDLANFNGSVGLNLAATQNIADAAGNSLATAEPTNDQMFAVAAYQHLTYAGTDSSALAVKVVNGKLEVKIGGVLQPLATPALVGSLTFTGGSKNDSVVLTGLSSSQYSHLTRIVMTGGDGKDTLTGSDFAETISGGLGNDVLKGGGGMDCLTESGDVTFVLTNARLTGLGTDSLAGFDEAALTGGDQANKLDASAFTGNVTLLGGSGDDTLIGGGGNDSLDGALGDDVLTGNAGQDFLGGGAGDDTLGGGAGNDQLFGGNGTDQIVASGAKVYVLDNSSLTGEGTDTLNRIDTATITTSEKENSSVDASAFDGSVTLIGGAGLDTLTGGGGDDSLFGAAGNDVLKGGDGKDILRGEAGNDTLDGEAGDDFLLGALGNDDLRGGDGSDRVIESANANLTLTNSSMTGLGIDMLSSIETANLTGGTGNNPLSAAAFTLGSVTLIGSAGN